MYSLTQVEQITIVSHLVLASVSLGYIVGELVLSYIKYKVSKEVANYPIGIEIIRETSTADILTLRSVAEISARDMTYKYDSKERITEGLKRQLSKQAEQLIVITEDTSRYSTPNTVLQAELRVLKPRKGAE